MKKFVEINVDGKVYKLRLGIRQLAALEDQLGMNLNVILNKFQAMADGDVSLAFILTVWHQAFLGNNSGMTFEDASDVFDDIGLADALPLLGETIVLALPAKKKTAPKTRTPRKAKGSPPA